MDNKLTYAHSPPVTLLHGNGFHRTQALKNDHTPGKGSDFCSISPQFQCSCPAFFGIENRHKMKKLITNIMELLNRLFCFDPDDEILDDLNDR